MVDQEFPDTWRCEQNPDKDCNKCTIAEKKITVAEGRFEPKPVSVEKQKEQLQKNIEKQQKQLEKLAKQTPVVSAKELRSRAPPPPKPVIRRASSPAPAPRRARSTRYSTPSGAKKKVKLCAKNEIGSGGGANRVGRIDLSFGEILGSGTGAEIAAAEGPREKSRPKRQENFWESAELRFEFAIAGAEGENGGRRCGAKTENSAGACETENKSKNTFEKWTKTFFKTKKRGRAILILGQGLSRK